MSEVNLKVFTREINIVCLKHGVKLIAGQAEREGLLMIENDKEFVGYKFGQNSHAETFLEECNE